MDAIADERSTIVSWVPNLDSPYSIFVGGLVVYSKPSFHRGEANYYNWLNDERGLHAVVVWKDDGLWAEVMDRPLNVDIAAKFGDDFAACVHELLLSEMLVITMIPCERLVRGRWMVNFVLRFWVSRVANASDDDEVVELLQLLDSKFLKCDCVGTEHDLKACKFSNTAEDSEDMSCGQ